MICLFFLICRLLHSYYAWACYNPYFLKIYFTIFLVEIINLWFDVNACWYCARWKFLTVLIFFLEPYQKVVDVLYYLCSLSIRVLQSNTCFSNSVFLLHRNTKYPIWHTVDTYVVDYDLHLIYSCNMWDIVEDFADGVFLSCLKSFPM